MHCFCSNSKFLQIRDIKFKTFNVHTVSFHCAGKGPIDTVVFDLSNETCLSLLSHSIHKHFIGIDFSRPTA